MLMGAFLFFSSSAFGMGAVWFFAFSARLEERRSCPRHASGEGRFDSERRREKRRQQVGEFRDSLTAEECAIFDAGHKAAADVQEWKRRRKDQLKTSAVFKRSAPPKLR